MRASSRGAAARIALLSRYRNRPWPSASSTSSRSASGRVPRTPWAPCAPRAFVTKWLVETGELESAQRACAEVFGSLALTGRGHGTDKAVLMMDPGHQPNLIDPDLIPAALERIRGTKTLRPGGTYRDRLRREAHLVMNKRQKLPFHTNGMRFTAFDATGAQFATRDYYSGRRRLRGQPGRGGRRPHRCRHHRVARTYHSGDELLRRCADTGMSIARLMYANEQAWRSGEGHLRRPARDLASHAELPRRGIRAAGTCPAACTCGPARAQSARRAVVASGSGDARPLTVLDWVNLYALAVNEENAAGAAWSPRPPTAPPASSRRCCTTTTASSPAPTSRACSTSCSPPPRSASLQGERQHQRRRSRLPGRGRRGLLDGRCGPDRRALGGTPGHRNAAEIGMEHNLGLTCDPIGGPVQILHRAQCDGRGQGHQRPRMALRGDGKHKVSLDKVIKTMRDTGRDMQDKYKETSRGGLAVNVIEVLRRRRRAPRHAGAGDLLEVVAEDRPVADLGDGGTDALAHHGILRNGTASAVGQLLAVLCAHWRGRTAPRRYRQCSRCSPGCWCRVQSDRLLEPFTPVSVYSLLMSGRRSHRRCESCAWTRSPACSRLARGDAVAEALGCCR